MVVSSLSSMRRLYPSTSALRIAASLCLKPLSSMRWSCHFKVSKRGTQDLEKPEEWKIRWKKRLDPEIEKYLSLQWKRSIKNILNIFISYSIQISQLKMRCPNLLEFLAIFGSQARFCYFQDIESLRFGGVIILKLCCQFLRFRKLNLSCIISNGL